MSNDLQAFVRRAYQVVLGRPPENDAVVSWHAQVESPLDILSNLAESEEGRARLKTVAEPGSPFHHYASLFDAEATVRHYARQDLVPDPGWITNFMGVRIEEDYLPSLLHGRCGTIEPVPIPANWHADIAEWAAALRAVDLSSGTFSVVELGCGWGCWLNNTGVAARSRGLKPNLIGVEGDEGHIDFAKRCCALNGFAPEEVTLHRGVAAVRPGTALFPRQDVAGATWDLKPVFGATVEEERHAIASGRYDVLPMIPLSNLVDDGANLDLLHIDIQGGEADLIEQGREFLSEKVAYVLIGTHSRVIEGRIEAALQGDVWRLEIERSAIVRLTPTGPITTVDGVQGWRNMRLRPDRVLS